ncbi:MAG: energy-coupling factor transporter ATPase [Clostridia bacterium]|nr:energy-coupling factor transporter ATPase [Clostridia bacterium]
MQIACKDLTFIYNAKTKFHKTALDRATLTINEGDFFGIIGHTGSGKSTFIQHIDALLTATSGELKVGDTDLSPTAKKDKNKIRELRSKVGIVFQYPEYQLFEETVFKEVAFGYKNFFPQASGEEIKNAVIGAVKAVGLDLSLLNASPFELSGGQKRRVAIAGVIVSRPEILILDEPVAGLDPVGKTELMSLLHALHETTCKTIIIVSHDMDEVAENCTRAAVFSEGKVVAVGTPEEIFKEAEKLKEMRLDVPVTAYLTNKLKEVGVDAENDFTTDGFIKKITEIYKKNA